jgi:hypothetical protein
MTEGALNKKGLNLYNNLSAVSIRRGELRVINSHI